MSFPERVGVKLLPDSNISNIMIMAVIHVSRKGVKYIEMLGAWLSIAINIYNAKISKQKSYIRLKFMQHSSFCLKIIQFQEW